GEPRRVIVRDVAIEGWNWRNSTAFLRDHFDALRPDVVVFLPIGNDLSNTEGIWETGHRRLAPDLGTDDPWTYVNLNEYGQWVRSLQAAYQRGELALRSNDLGPTVLNCDLGGESTRRLDEMAAGIAALARDLAAQHVRFAILRYEPDPVVLAVERRLAHDAPTIPVIPLLDEVRGS